MIYNVQELFTRLVNSGRHGIVQKIVKQEKKKKQRKREKEMERNSPVAASQQHQNRVFSASIITWRLRVEVFTASYTFL